jgi:hypothetical protein
MAPAGIGESMNFGGHGDEGGGDIRARERLGGRA